MTKASAVISADKVLSNSIEDGECLLWQGAMANGTCPVCRVGGKVVPVRQALWKAMGRRLPDKAAVLASCKQDCCVAPEHLVLGKRGSVLGVPKSPAARANMARAQRANSTITEADAAVIREAVAPLKKLMEQYGLCKRAIQDIRRGASWSNHHTSPFAGLMK